MRIMFGIVVGLYLGLAAYYGGRVWAQQPPSPAEAAIKAQLGELAFNNTILMTEMKRLTDENTKLKAELAELKKANGGGNAKHDTKDGTNDGRSRP